jgi:hypothetical protein
LDIFKLLLLRISYYINLFISTIINIFRKWENAKYYNYWFPRL